MSKRLDDKVISISQQNTVNQFEQYSPEWITMSDVKAKTQPWFWPAMVPDHTITLVGGVGGIGKSLLLLFIMAKTTSGEKFHAGGYEHQLPQGEVILLSAEDDVEYHIKPKLIAAGANTNKIHFIKSKIGNISKVKKFLELDKDLFILENKLQENKNIRLIIIDPIAYFIGEIHDHHNPEVANFLQNLIDFAKKYQIAIIFNKHLRKKSTSSKSVSSAADEIGGAGSWTNTPRRCWLISDHPDDEEIKIITRMKDNLDKRNKQALGYKIQSTSIVEEGISIETTELVWLEEMQEINSSEAINPEAYEKSKLQFAIDFIYQYLVKNGQSRLTAIRDEAIKKGIKQKTFRTAYEEFEKDYADNLKIDKGIKGAKMYALLC